MHQNLNKILVPLAATLLEAIQSLVKLTYMVQVVLRTCNQMWHGIDQNPQTSHWDLVWSWVQSLIVHCTGNPQVVLAIPIPATWVWVCSWVSLMVPAGVPVPVPAGMS
jgi:hypothetical protein